jgi:DNA-binding NarL/FixJ family response regulator
MSAMRLAVVLDPHPLWIDAVTEVLRRISVAVAARAATPEEALEAVGELQPDLLILETAPYAAADGASLVRRARTLRHDLRCVVLSSRDDPDAIEAALAAGASAYVVKTAYPEDLASAVRQAFEHSVYFKRLASEPEGAPAQAVGSDLLTRRELEIVELVASGRPNAEIAKTLWITEQTVKFHLSNIYRKLEVSNRTEAARWAHLNGLLTEERVRAGSSVSLTTAEAALERVAHLG